MALKTTAKESAGRLVMAVFHRYKAYGADSVIGIDKFMNVPLTNDMIAYTFGNLIEEGVIVAIAEDQFYFDQEVWKKLENKVNRMYWMMLLLPIVLAAIFLIVFNFNTIKTWITNLLGG